MIKLCCGDCFSYLYGLPDRSVDMILCDLPYGATHCKWDTPIDLQALWREYMRIIKPGHAIVLFGQQPFSAELINSNKAWFKYHWVWVKDRCPNFMMAKYAPLKHTEDILVFSDGKINTNTKNKMVYYPQGLVAINKKIVSKVKKTGINVYNCLSGEHTQEYTNYPKNTLYFATDKKPLHPTSKPVELCKYLIKTYTQEGDVVLDNCMGCGSTGVACKQLNRDFIGMEIDKGFFDIAEARIWEAKNDN